MQGASRALGSRREGGLLGSGKAAEKAGGPRLRAVSVRALPPPTQRGAWGGLRAGGGGCCRLHTPCRCPPPAPPAGARGLPPAGAQLHPPAPGRSPVTESRRGGVHGQGRPGACAGRGGRWRRRGAPREPGEEAAASGAGGRLTVRFRGQCTWGLGRLRPSSTTELSLCRGRGRAGGRERR